MKSNLFEGNYLFHLHTHLTDGHLSVKEYFEFAREKNIDRLIFLEHIRREPTYCPKLFAEDIKKEESRTGIQAFVGFEAKLLPEGRLDISEEHLALADVIGLAEHGFPAGFKIFHNAFIQAIQHYRNHYPDLPMVWAHPGLWYRKNRCFIERQSDYIHMLQHAQNKGVLLEHNLRYQLVPENMLQLIDCDSLVFGIDAHHSSDLIDKHPNIIKHLREYELVNQ